MVSRRTLLRGGLASTLAAMFDGGEADPARGDTGQPPIDRRAVVSRHNVVRTGLNRRSPLQVGNGRFAFGADVTGLQTFAAFNTLSEWAWHTAPLPAGQTPADLHDATWQSRTRGVPYDSGDAAHPQITAWAFANPSRINLGRIGLALLKADGTPATAADLTAVRQELDLWTGTLHSRFTVDGGEVTVTTACHPDADAVAFRIGSPLVAAGRLSAYVDFPAPDGRQFADAVGTWAHSARTPTVVTASADRRIDLLRRSDADAYHVAVTWEPGTSLHRPDAVGGRRPAVAVSRARYGADGGWVDVTAAVAAAVAGGSDVTADQATFGSDPAPKRRKRLEVTYTVDGAEHVEHVAENETWTVGDRGGANCFRLTGSAASLAFAVAFSPDPLPADVPGGAAAVAVAAADGWPRFWASGGAIDLSASADPRWRELERRVVLSQYLMAVNEAGTLPPQESGLVNTGWFGKFHMEMYWWHAAHYALWDRWGPLDRSSGVYARMLPDATARARRQGYAGARWTKMAGPDFHNAAFYTNALLVWQQPHPMFLAELEYRARPTRATLDKWAGVLFPAADFMASYPDPDAAGRLCLGPCMMVVSENTDMHVTTNPTFELAYWRFGLGVAQRWRERLGRPREPHWDQVLAGLAPLPVEGGVYVTYEGIPDMWTKYTRGHPALTGAFGWLPGDGVDPAVMRATLDRVMSTWQWRNDVWGWDYPMLAMCAARLRQPARAVDLLLTPNAGFGFDDAGLATGGPYPYFPSNGGLLYAVAMMAAGWDGAPAGPSAPGFPDPARDGGRWVVRHEGLRPAL